MHLAVDFRHDSGITGVAGLEEFGHTRQTAGDIASAAARCTRNLHEHLAALDLLAILLDKVSAHGQSVKLELLAVLIDDGSLGHLGAILAFDDHMILQA